MTLPVPLDQGKSLPLSVMEQLAEIPEEEIWLASQKSARTRRAYRLDVRHFMATLGLTEIDRLRRIDHRAVIA
jgi:integrase/recombinase XerD